MAGDPKSVTIRTKKKLTNPLLQRRQMVVEVIHGTVPTVSKEIIREKLASMHKVKKNLVSCFGFRTQFGGGRSTGFALIYDSEEALKKFEPKYRLARLGFPVEAKTNRKQRKERKNRAKKVRGKKKAAILSKK